MHGPGFRCRQRLSALGRANFGEAAHPGHTMLVCLFPGTVVLHAARAVAKVPQEVVLGRSGA